MTREIPLKAVVDENEKAALIIAAEQIGTSLTAAAGEPITVDCDFAVSLETLKSSRERSIVVTSLLREVENYKTPWPEVELRLRNDYEALVANPCAIVFVTTIFRHVAHPEGDQARLMRIRIRRLDRFAAEIFREFGVMVIDIDRDLADIGASKLRTDYRLTGQYAKPVAAKCIALAVISTGLDEYVSFEIQEAAKLAVANDNLAQGIPPTTDVKPSNILSSGTGRAQADCQDDRRHQHREPRGMARPPSPVRAVWRWGCVFQAEGIDRPSRLARKRDNDFGRGSRIPT